MGDVFVRKTTGLLGVLVAVLAVVCVAFGVLLFSSKGSSKSDAEFLPNVEVPPEKLKADSPSTESPMSKMSLEPSKAEDELTEPWEKDVRLPESTYPYHYDLMLYPNLDTEIFTGKVTITIGVKKPMSYLLVHVKSLNISRTLLKDSMGMNVNIMQFFEYKPNEFWVVKPEHILKAGNYSLSLDFAGPLRGPIVGFYLSEYKTSSGEQRKIATSKFQPTFARRAFPCFDEPSFKSTFKTTIVRPSQGYIALSNMPVQKEIPDSPERGVTSVEFQVSVPMVTYLACFIVCDFEHLEVMTKDNKPFRVYATKDQISRANYAQDIGVNILNFFEDYFGIKYPLPKQDMIAIPDFVSGAMEHWGLITYRETNLLYDDVGSSSYNKQRVASVISHELAHMWFGNLATLKWWNDLWLNEGFASYIEYKGVDNYHKDWDMIHQFVIADLQSVMKLDEILSSHPIVQTVNHPDQITEIFDKVSYSKGASVLRMLEDFLGGKQFKMGVSNFLNRFKYDNAITQDLWDELQVVQNSNLNITRIMDTWTRQMGFPVLQVKTNPLKKNEIEIRQERFLIDPMDKSADDSSFNYKWDIPVTYKTDILDRELKWMKMDDDKITVARSAGARWMKLNVDQYGYYRVNYDEKLWNELIQVLVSNHESLSPSDRANLIDDGLSLAAAQMTSYDTAFKVISYLSHESHYVPWRAAYDHLNDLSSLLENYQAYKYLRRFILQLVEPQVAKVGFRDEGSHIERRHRLIVISLACANGHSNCLSHVAGEFKNWIGNSSYPVPANLRSIIYKYGIERSGAKEWDILLERHSKELNAQEKSNMLTGLVSTREPWIAKNFLETAKNESVIRKQDYLHMLIRMSRNPSALHIVWNFVRSNWESLVEKYGLEDRYLGRMVRDIGFRFTTEWQLNELKAFFEKYPEAGAGKRARSQALQKAEKNIRWIQKFRNPLHMWLKKESDRNSHI